MKKILPFIMILTISVMISNNARAQQYYITVNAGYNHQFSTQNIYNDDLDLWMVNSSSGTNSQTLEPVFVSLGRGASFGGAFGIMFTDYVGLELAASYLIGFKSKAEQTWNGGEGEQKINSKMFRFIPSVVITPGLDNVNPYAKFGIVFGMGSVINEYDETDDGDQYYYKAKLNGGLAFGLNSAVGVMFDLSDAMGLFAELNMVNMSYAPKKGELVEATYNGADLLPDMTTREKEIEFVKELTYTYETSSPDSEPQEVLKYKMPSGSFGARIGLVYQLGK
ncbi:MAG: outer membrane beta-barrel protein [Bacteroidales bacterium]|nr:outer membrane beta-barrel protein [Bacteroidales bacterium]